MRSLIKSLMHNMQFPKAHLLLVGLSTTIFIATAYSSLFNAKQGPNGPIINNSIPLTLPIIEPLNSAKASSDNTLTLEKRLSVKPGDSLASIGKTIGVASSEIHSLSTSRPHGKMLRKIRPGEVLSFFFNKEKALSKLIYRPSPLKEYLYEKQGRNFKSATKTITPDSHIAFNHGVIQQSLFLSSQKAGLSDALTMRLAQIFQWDIDFVLDIRPGDSFYIMYEELFLDDKFIGHGDILAAQFINQKKSYVAVSFENEKGLKNFYSLTGESMRKAFLRAPVEFSRISSSFNLRRKHPLYKTIKAHRGIDYAAPKGTPILAAGDGRVTKASRTKPNGRYVVIQHGQQFVTKYLHLSKFGRGIRAGEKIKQGQVLGYVGQTGYATGPHLHYEFLVDGVHKNPRTVKLPKAKPVMLKNRRAFENLSSQLAGMLQNYKGQMTLVSSR